MADDIIEAGMGFDVDESRPEVPSVPWLANSVVEEGFVRRTRALLRTAPLHRLADVLGWQAFDSNPYDPRVLCLAAIDVVIARMGLASEITYEDALVVVAELARIAAPDRPEDEHLKVAGYVLDGLLNDRDQNDSQQFALTYSDYTQGHTQRELRFFLLTEKSRPDGKIVLEASDDAVNVFRGGLNLRVEDAQMAMELVLQAQLERGDLDEAEVTAEQNQRLSYEIGAQIRGLLDATRSDVSRVDWRNDVLERLDRARTHVGARIDVEGRILAHLTSGDEAREEDVKRKSLRVATLLESCLREHRRLHERLMGASTVFLGEQARQELRFRGHGVGLFSCVEHLLAPTLHLGRSDASAVGTTFSEAVLGARAPRVPRLCDLIPMLLRIRAVGPGEDPIDDEADYSDAEDDVEAYDSTVVDAASLVIAPARKEPTRLSALLEAARSWDREVEELVRLSVLWAFAPEFDDEIPGATLDLIDPDMAVVRSGELLVTEGWTGDDLVVGPAHLLAQLDGDALVNVENDEAGAEDEADEDLAVVKT
jgi:hypothetical protein